jgi:hypothetical protein
MCWSKACRNSEFQYSGLDDWVLFALYLKNSAIGRTAGERLLELGEANDEETLDALIQLDFAHESALARKRARADTE